MKIFKTLFSILFALVVLCPAPAKAADIGKLAVTPSGYDNMGAVLSGMGYATDEISWDDLANLEKLKTYSAVYINCSGSVDGVLEQAAPVVKQYVAEGGVIYASDWANSLISLAFPGKISFYNSNNTNAGLGARVGQSGKVTAKVKDAGMAAVLGKSEIEVNFDLASWAVIQATTGRTYFSGPAGVLDYTTMGQNYQNFDTSNLAELQKQLESMQAKSSKTLPDIPYVVSFNEGKGEVLYTSFHNEAQNSEDVAKVLSWFAIRTQASSMAQANLELAKSGEKGLLEIVDGINKGQTKTFKFDATGEAPFKVVLNFGGSTLDLTVKDPAGKQVATQSVSEPPYTAEVTTPVQGKYTITVTAKDIPNDNYPYVVTVLGSPTAATVVQTTEAVGATTSTGVVQSVLQALQAKIWWLILAALVFLILVVVIVLIKINKPHPTLPKDKNE